MMRRGYVRIALIALAIGWSANRVRHRMSPVMIMPASRAARANTAPAARGIPVVAVTTIVQDTADHDDSDKDTEDSSDDSDDDQQATPAHAEAGSRTLTIGRQFRAARDTAGLMHVKVSYGVGTLNMAPVDAPWLYNVRLGYTAPSKTPAMHFDTVSRTLSIGSNSKSTTVTLGKHDSKDSDLHVGLARGVPLDLDVEFGAGDADLRLGGLSVRDLSVSTGASDATVRFDVPNPIPLERLKLEIGAAGFKAVGLGNAHVKAITVEAGVGDVDLDFGGHWTSDIDLDVTAALGAVHIHVPHGVIVEQTRDKTIIGSMEDNTGGSAGAGAPQSPGGPIYHLRARGTTTLGSIEFDRQVAN
jgi:hypothetical protein